MNNGASNFIATNAVAVTPSNTADNAYSYLYIGGAGDVSVVTEGGDTVTFVGLVAGSYVWVRTSKVRSTSTTATNIVGLS